VQLHSQSAQDFQNGAEARAPFSRERLAETLARQSGIAGHVRHSLGARDVAHRFGEKCLIVTGLREAGVRVGRYFARGALVRKRETGLVPSDTLSRFCRHRSCALALLLLEPRVGEKVEEEIVKGEELKGLDYEKRGPPGKR